MGSGSHGIAVVAETYGWLRFVVLAGLAAAGSPYGFCATRPPVLVDLADLARAQPAEFATDALLRFAAAPTLTEVA